MSYQSKKCLLEVDVGITNFIGNNKGFSGTLKHRFSDFHVNEVRLDGSIVKLTDESVPDEAAESADVDYKIDAVSPEILLQLVELAMHGGQEVIIDVTDKSKSERREMHDLVRKKFPSKLVSNTKEKYGKKVLVVSKSNKSEADRRPTWPARRKGDYVHFVMHKENKDTMEVVNLIARKLKMKPNYITYAGTKDRRAKTSQMLCVRRVEPCRLAAINKHLNYINLGNYVFQPAALRLGDLKGNHFKIALRNVIGAEEDIKCALNYLKSEGFINYYGLQRFGSSFEVPTYYIGRALLLGEWAKAIDLILASREYEARDDVRAARATWQETRNAEAAYGKLGKGQNTVEGKLLQGLVKNGSDVMGALNFIPRNMRLLYLHSYQSLIWNKVASQRIEEFGLKPVVGDLVLRKVEDGTSADCMLQEVVSECNAGALPEDCNGESQPDAVTASEGVCNEEEIDFRGRQVCVLTEEQVKEASILDVVLPLPGYSVTYPNNTIAGWYEDLLKVDGLTSATMRQKAKSYSLRGSYRHLVVRPDYMSWKALRYSSPDDTLILSDVEQLRLVETPRDNPDGEYKALVVEFMLPPSCYATMALRQVMRQDTSAGFQANLGHHVQRHKRMCDTEESPLKKLKSDDYSV
ncbi:hypothetical protein PR048_025587 [Dryococelus australis]|uniref:TRUD domain-containing protein n=1 Tax=Dryococelus australis TaxID=614101 RepID=A0ABQ9GRR0_9NEOP|nr:hypothetical protein PR048_025587 [Dryococelus australis]